MAKLYSKYSCGFEALRCPQPSVQLVSHAALNILCCILSGNLHGNLHGKRYWLLLPESTVCHSPLLRNSAVQFACFLYPRFLQGRQHAFKPSSRAIVLVLTVILFSRPGDDSGHRSRRDLVCTQTSHLIVSLYPSTLCKSSRLFEGKSFHISSFAWPTLLLSVNLVLQCAIVSWNRDGQAWWRLQRKNQICVASKWQRQRLWSQTHFSPSIVWGLCCDKQPAAHGSRFSAMATTPALWARSQALTWISPCQVQAQAQDKSPTTSTTLAKADTAKDAKVCRKHLDMLMQSHVAMTILLVLFQHAMSSDRGPSPFMRTRSSQTHDALVARNRSARRARTRKKDPQTVLSMAGLRVCLGCRIHAQGQGFYLPPRQFCFGCESGVSA